MIWIDVLLCHIAYGVIKLSILLFYKRIFITPWFQKAANIFMGIVVAWMFAATFVSKILSTILVDIYVCRDKYFLENLSTHGGTLVQTRNRS